MPIQTEHAGTDQPLGERIKTDIRDTFSNEFDRRVDEGFNRIDAGVGSLQDELNKRLDQGANRLDEAAGGLQDSLNGRLDEGLNRLDEGVGTLEAKVEERVDEGLEGLPEFGFSWPPKEPPGASTLVALPGYRVNRADVLKINLAGAYGSTGEEPIDGLYRVDADGTVDLRRYGKVRVADQRLADAERLIEQQLSQSIYGADVSLGVAAAESQVYYIVVEGTGQGDNVWRVPLSTGDTIDAAVRVATGIRPDSIEKIWIARPAPGGTGREELLPIQWNAAGQFASPNYPLAPGDGVFISGPRLPAQSDVRQWITAWFDRIRR